MKYKRIVIFERGGQDKLKLIEDELPEPSNYQVRIKIKAAGVSFADLLMREGVYIDMPAFPFTLGYDIVGTIDKTGASVAKFKIDDTVAALTKTGGYSEYILINEEELISVPSELDPSEVVSLILNYITAYQMLFRSAKIKEGETIIINGAAGGVGTALLQLGKLKNLKMFGTASKEKLHTVRELGGIPIDYKSDDFIKIVKEINPAGVDVVFEGTGKLARRSYKILKPNGRLIVYGISSMLVNGRRNYMEVIKTYLRFSIFLRNIIPNKRKVLLYQITGYKKKHPDWFKEDAAELLKLLSAKKIKPIIAHKLPLEKAALAHELLNESKVIGKIVLLPNQ